MKVKNYMLVFIFFVACSMVGIMLGQVEKKKNHTRHHTATGNSIKNGITDAERAAAARQDLTALTITQASQNGLLKASFYEITDEYGDDCQLLFQIPTYSRIHDTIPQSFSSSGPAPAGVSWVVVQSVPTTSIGKIDKMETHDFFSTSTTIDVDNATNQKWTVYMDGEVVAGLPSRQRLTIKINPGEHTVMARSSKGTIEEWTAEFESENKVGGCSYVINIQSHNSYTVSRVSWSRTSF